MTGQTPDDKKNTILDACADYKKTFAKAGIRATFDSRDNYTPGWKFNHWEMKVLHFCIKIFFKIVKFVLQDSWKRIFGWLNWLG